SSNSERRGRDFGQRIGKAEEILANQKRLNYKLSGCNLLKHIPPSDTVWMPFAITPNEAPLLPLFDKRGTGGVSPRPLTSTS
ncbi:MAG: hypothetical protein J6L86_05285, partial [Alphaproteobacteria bacterium]|nr:hypothetical protein [Alphaproteobacteria bacterium]